MDFGDFLSIVCIVLALVGTIRNAKSAIDYRKRAIGQYFGLKAAVTLIISILYVAVLFYNVVPSDPPWPGRLSVTMLLILLLTDSAIRNSESCKH